MESDLVRGNQLLRSGKLEEAVSAFEKAIAHHPNFHWSHYKLGEALEQLGRLEEAIVAYRKANDLNPRFDQVLRKLETEPKKKILIHIGTAKTGSTAIQKSLTFSFKNNQNNILYAGLPHCKIAPLYYQEYKDLPRGFLYHYSESEFKDLKEEYKTNLFNLLRIHQNIILSSEYFSVFKFKQIEKLRIDLDNIGGCEYQILVYIREPASYYLSLAQQQLKASSSFTSPRNYHYTFMNTVNLWSKVFSPEQLNIRIFNREFFPEGSVILDFQNCVEKFFNKKIKLDLGSSDANESLSAESMIILQKYRQFVYPNEDNVFKKDSNILISYLQKSKNEILQTKPQLLEKVASYIRKKHEEDIYSLKNIYGINLQNLSKEHSDSSPEISQEDSAIDASSIEDILENFDINIVINLLLWIARNNFSNSTTNKQ
ncbi:tetratricopeptide repeat protein [Microcoleus sp. B3-A4]|uniref:tetratricopeptide repeat protein n=1 Tax=Microcoleus sp. B3-A4 TaxID=2818653 RepID=UPI002FD6AB58